MNREIREAIRYLGYGRHAIDEQTLALVECSMEELKAKVRERFIYRIFELSQKDGVLQIGDWTIESKGLSRNLKGCGRVAAFAATLGTEADQMIRRASVMEMAKAVVLQSCAAALLEEYCDDCQEEIAKELDMPVERVREILKISQEPVSLETPIGEEEDSHLGDFIQDDNVPVPAEAAAQTLLKEQLDEVLDTLTEREQKVLRLRFGMNDGRARTLEEVGKEFDVTRERIRQIEAKALRKLRHPSRSRKLRDYLD